jgi:3-hydroxy-9,10-secoandrosta-1,3,5(10)-triene-9,17-dione monooxygenase reductase component
VTIHAGDPFATPERGRDPVRRLRGRLAATVTLWTAYGPDDRPAGLTVSSTTVADGDPGRLLGLVDEESELLAAVRHSGRFAVSVLPASDRRVADMFAGVMPVPGGPFRARTWVRSGYGPVRAERDTWAGCRLDEVRPLGWAMLVLATLEEINLTEPGPSLIHYRGRYADGPAGGPGDPGASPRTDPGTGDS